MKLRVRHELEQRRAGELDPVVKARLGEAARGWIALSSGSHPRFLCTTAAPPSGWTLVSILCFRNWRNRTHYACSAAYSSAGLSNGLPRRLRCCCMPSRGFRGGKITICPPTLRFCELALDAITARRRGHEDHIHESAALSPLRSLRVAHDPRSCLSPSAQLAAKRRSGKKLQPLRFLTIAHPCRNPPRRYKLRS